MLRSSVSLIFIQVAGPNLAFGESATIDVPVLEGGYLITLAVPNSNITVAQMLQVPQYEVGILGASIVSASYLPFHIFPYLTKALE